MEQISAPRLKRDDWIKAALSALQDRGMENIKIVELARELGVTSGSFYWHFKDLNELLQSTLDYWELDLTDRIVERSRSYPGKAVDRIFELMVAVIRHDAAAPDHAISVWARRDEKAQEVFVRTLKKRFDFAAWMFEQVGFSKADAAIRGRLFVAYLIGESSTNLKEQPGWEDVLRRELDILIS